MAQVEVSVLAPSGNDAVGEDMKSFADQLRPLVGVLILIFTFILILILIFILILIR